MEKKTCGRNISYGGSEKYSEIDSRAKWLWLDPEKHPQFINTQSTFFENDDSFAFCVTEFERVYSLPEDHPGEVEIAIFADTKFRLYVNGKYIGFGPVCAGGDCDRRRPMPKHYYNHYTVPLEKGCRELRFFVQVHNLSPAQTDQSSGRCGFILSAAAGEECFFSDESWKVRLAPAYQSPYITDLTAAPCPWEQAYPIPAEEAPWKLEFADIPMLRESAIRPQSEKREDGKIFYEFDRIYSAFVVLGIENKTGKPVQITLTRREVAEEEQIFRSVNESITAGPGHCDFRTLTMNSIGQVILPEIAGVEYDLSLSYVRYPNDDNNTGYFRCSDPLLNEIYEEGKFTLEMCRQSIHLDSPLHQETLGCTGDYAIESLMTHATFGDLRLSRLDLIRTADLLKDHGAFMFHTSYSLLWTAMLLDYYLWTGDRELVESCKVPLGMLLSRFRGYYGNRGVIENLPNCMFVEWGDIDGFSMHHPPFALGLTALNAFYAGALENSAALYTILGMKDESQRCLEEEKALKAACRKQFWDEEKKMFRDGLTKSEIDNKESFWLPKNTEKNYHTRHANILAVLYGLSEGEEARELMRRVLTCESLDGETVLDIQPYFMHYLFEAAAKTGLYEEYAFPMIAEKWKGQLDHCRKGMPEGWGLFIGDNSHAWGASPTYQLPMRMLGFEMLEPGFARFRLSPKLIGVEEAEIAIPSPCGLIRCEIKKGAAPIVTVPEEYEGRYEIVRS